MRERERGKVALNTRKRTVVGRQTIRRALNFVLLVVSNFLPVLRGKGGRNPGEKIEHDQAEMG